MFRTTLFRCLMVAALLAFATSSSMWAQTQSKTTAQKTEKKFRGRLPNGYGKIVTQRQRAEIYKIQEKYFTQKAELERQLEELKQKERDEIFAVLTPQQQATFKAAQDRSKAPAEVETTSNTPTEE